MAECPSSAKQALEKLSEQLTCPICLDHYTDPKLLQCFHVFCEKCLKPLACQTPCLTIYMCTYRSSYNTTLLKHVHDKHILLIYPYSSPVAVRVIGHMCMCGYTCIIIHVRVLRVTVEGTCAIANYVLLMVPSSHRVL